MKNKTKTALSKKLLIPVAAAALVVTGAIPTFGAGIYDENSSVGASFSWSMYDWTASYYTAWDNDYRLIGAWNDMKFDSQAVYELNIDYYDTFEINHVDDDFPHTGWYASNIPSVQYDRDDDNKNGYSEEIEAYEGTAYENFSTSGSYYFQTAWEDYGDSGGIGTFKYIQQRSAYGYDSDFNYEVQAVHYDLIDQRSYVFGNVYAANSVESLENADTAGSSALGDLFGVDKASAGDIDNRNVHKEKLFQVNQVVDQNSEGKKERELIVHKNIKNKQDLADYAARQNELANELKKQDVDVLITLNGALSEQEVKKLANKYGLDVTNFEIKGTDNNGDWVTIGGVPAEDGKLFHQGNFDAVTKGLDVTVEGYTMLEGTLKGFNANRFANLQADERVVLADLTAEYAKQVYGEEVDVKVADIAQTVANWK